jgi:hypothetical protein
MALPCWAQALEGRPPALLLTLDRHVDLLVPRALPPDRQAPLRLLEEYARWDLDERSVDHVAAAMEVGLVRDVLCVARTPLPGVLAAGPWTDRRGVTHLVHVVPTLQRLVEEPSDDVERLLAAAGPLLLDVDLDVFTTLSDADPTTVIPWPRDVIRDFLLPPGSGPFWDRVLSRCVALTVAREPAHCGGVVPAGRLLEDVAEVLFCQLLGVDLP